MNANIFFGASHHFLVLISDINPLSIQWFVWITLYGFVRIAFTKMKKKIQGFLLQFGVWCSFFKLRRLELGKYPYFIRVLAKLPIWYFIWWFRPDILLIYPLYGAVFSELAKRPATFWGEGGDRIKQISIWWVSWNGPKCPKKLQRSAHRWVAEDHERLFHHQDVTHGDGRKQTLLPKRGSPWRDFGQEHKNNAHGTYNATGNFMRKQRT